MGTLRFAAEMKRLRSCFKSRLGNGRRGVEGKLFSGDGRQSDGGREGSGAGGRKTSAKVHFLFVRSERCNRTSPHRRSSIDRSSTERVQPALPQSPTRQRSPQPPVPFLLHPQVLLPPPPLPLPCLHARTSEVVGTLNAAHTVCSSRAVFAQRDGGQHHLVEAPARPCCSTRISPVRRGGRGPRRERAGSGSGCVSEELALQI